MTLRYEGVRFSDGSCAIRRVAADPCERATLTFESVRELEEDIGTADVTWLADGQALKVPGAPGLLLGELLPGERPVPFKSKWGEGQMLATVRPAYIGDGHPAVRAAAPPRTSRYEPTDEVDEP